MLSVNSIHGVCDGMVESMVLEDGYCLGLLAGRRGVSLGRFPVNPFHNIHFPDPHDGGDDPYDLHSSTTRSRATRSPGRENKLIRRGLPEDTPGGANHGINVQRHIDISSTRGYLSHKLGMNNRCRSRPTVCSYEQCVKGVDVRMVVRWRRVQGRVLGLQGNSCSGFLVLVQAYE